MSTAMPEEDLAAIDVGDNILDAVKVDTDGVPTFNPATHISTDVMDNLGAKLGELVAAAEKLAEKLRAEQERRAMSSKINELALLVADVKGERDAANAQADKAELRAKTAEEQAERLFVDKI